MNRIRNRLSFISFGIVFVSLTIVVALSSVATAAESTASNSPDISRIVPSSFVTLPMSFEPNVGQGPEHTKFLARGRGYTVSLTPTGATLVLTKAQSTDERPPFRAEDAPVMSTTTLGIRLANTRPTRKISALNRLPGKVNYYQGGDASQWRTDIPTFARVWYEEVYPGIDLVYYGNQQRLEYDFIVAPGTDPSGIRFALEGVDRFELADTGDLVLRAVEAQVTLEAPVAYQKIAGVRHEVAAQYALLDDGQIGFEVEEYDRTTPLVIDPILTYATYLDDVATSNDIAVDTNGVLYVTGYRYFFDDYGRDVFVMKLDPATDTLLYVTYLGGTEDTLGFGYDEGFGIAVDPSGNAYVTGMTQSLSDYPVSSGALQPVCRSLPYQVGSLPGGWCIGDAFVTKLNASGAMVYSTYLGGANIDIGHSIGVNGAGNAFVTGVTLSADDPGTSSDERFPTAGPVWFPNCSGDGPGPYSLSPWDQECEDGFYAKIHSSGTSLIQASYWGLGIGGNPDYANGNMGIFVDNIGNAWMTGYVGGDTFVTKLGASQGAGCTPISGDGCGNGPTYTTLLGASGASGTDIAADPIGNAYVVGEVGASGTIVTSPGAFDTTHDLGSDFFVAKLDPEGDPAYATYVGGKGNEEGFRSALDPAHVAIAVDGDGSAYIAGSTQGRLNLTTLMNENDYPVERAFQAQCGTDIDGCTYDAVVTKLHPSGSWLIYSSYLGGSSADWGTGIAVDDQGQAYVTGNTLSPDFPVTNGSMLSSSNYAFAAEIDAECNKICLRDNGDGTVTDTCQDLMWTKDINLACTLGAGTSWHGPCWFDHQMAQDWAAGLVYAGHDDWKIPGRVTGPWAAFDQMEVLYRYILGNPLGGPLVHTDPFENALQATDYTYYDAQNVRVTEPRVHREYWLEPYMGMGEPAFDLETGYVTDYTMVDVLRSAWAVRDTAETEQCDGVDDDCDGWVDEGYPIGDSCSVGLGACERFGVYVCAEDGASAECDAAPGSPTSEVCDGIDNDCDGIVPLTEIDNDSDGFSECEGDCDDADASVNPASAEFCNDGIDNDCNVATPDVFDGDLDGYTCVIDCDDTNSTIHPGAAELCNDGIDNDCNPTTPDIFDGDGDTYACDVDCSDSDANVHPGATELGCDGIDNDCNPSTPDLIDGDLDTYACGTDCDDTDWLVNPGATELSCDGKDNDCSASTPDVSDSDGDGWACDTDCDDSIAEIWDCNTPCCGEHRFEEGGHSVTLDVTAGGDTTITAEACDPARIDGFVLTTPSTPCLNVETDAGWSAPATVCIEYDDTGMTLTQEQGLTMFSCDGSVPPNCEPVGLDEDIDPNPNTDTNLVCGVTSHFSFLAVGTAADSDSDGTSDLLDNCPDTWNLFQTDSDFDGHGDSCDCGPTDPTSHPGGVELCDGLDNDCDTVTDNACLAACDSPGTWGDDRAVTLDSAGSGFAALAWTGSEYGVAWHDDRDGNWEIYFARLDVNGNRIGMDLRITHDDGTSGTPSLVWTGTEYGLAWWDDRDGNEEIYFCRLDATGNRIDVEDRRLTLAPGLSSVPSLVWTGKEYGVSWHDERDGNREIYFARLHPSGKKASADIRVTNDGAESAYPSLVWTDDRFAMAWHDTRDGNSEIYVARLHLLGTKDGADIRVTNDSASSEYPTLVWADNSFGVSWHDQRDGNWEIYFARLFALGGTIGADLRLTNDTATSGYPSLVWTGAEYGISWHDQRGGDWEVHHAIVDSAGVKISGDVQVSNAVGGSYSPSLVWAGTEYGMAWHDDRDANFEIYFSQVRCCTDVDLDGFTACQNDCNDGDPDINPLAGELCDGIDNDCDASIDEDFPTPGIVDGLVLDGDKATLRWTAESLADRYEVMKGDLATLLLGGGDFDTSLSACLEDDSTDTVSVDADDPAAGQAFYYLIRALRDCKAGTCDTGQPGQQGGRDVEIEASSNSCP